MTDPTLQKPAARDQNEPWEGHKRADLPLDAIEIDPAFNIDPRRMGDSELVEPLKQNIEQFGLLEPLVVHAVWDRGRLAYRYFLLAGFVRYAALKELGWKMVPVVIKEKLSELDALNINGAENTARRNVHPFYLAKRFDFLHTHHGQSYGDIARAHGRSESFVRNLMSTYQRTLPEIRQKVFETVDVSEDRVPTMAWLIDNSKRTHGEQQEAYEAKYGRMRDIRALEAADHGAQELDKKDKPAYRRSKDDMLRLLQVQLAPDYGLEVALKGFEGSPALSKRERVLCKALLLWSLDRRKPFPFREPKKKKPTLTANEE